MNAAETQAPAVVGNVIHKPVLLQERSPFHSVKTVQLISLSNLFIGFQHIPFAQSYRSLDTECFVPRGLNRSRFAVYHGIELRISVLIPEEALFFPVAIQIDQMVRCNAAQYLTQIAVAILAERIILLQQGIVFRILLFKQG